MKTDKPAAPKCPTYDELLALVSAGGEAVGYLHSHGSAASLEISERLRDALKPVSGWGHTEAAPAPRRPTQHIYDSCGTVNCPACYEYIMLWRQPAVPKCQRCKGAGVLPVDTYRSCICPDCRGTGHAPKAVLGSAGLVMNGPNEPNLEALAEVKRAESAASEPAGQQCTAHRICPWEAQGLPCNCPSLESAATEPAGQPSSLENTVQPALNALSLDSLKDMQSKIAARISELECGKNFSGKPESAASAPVAGTETLSALEWKAQHGRRLQPHFRWTDARVEAYRDYCLKDETRDKLRGWLAEARERESRLKEQLKQSEEIRWAEKKILIAEIETSTQLRAELERAKRELATKNKCCGQR